MVLAASTDSVAAASATLRGRVLLALGLGLLAALLVAVAVAHRIGEPLVRTAGTARRMAAGERGVPPRGDNDRSRGCSATSTGRWRPARGGSASS